MKTYTVKVYGENDRWWSFPKGTIIWNDENKDIHCEHGPALIFPSGLLGYYWHGWHVTKEVWKQKVAKSKQHTIEIDGKTITVSDESYENLKKELIG